MLQLCDLGDADVGYACRHLFQLINEHKHSVISKHLWDVHNLRNKDIYDQINILKKCHRKLNCLIYEMLRIAGFFAALLFLTYLCNNRLKPQYIALNNREK